MAGPGVGFEYPPREVAWLKRDVLLFANSIGCTVDELHFLYVSLEAAHEPGRPAADQS
jgi:peroxisomal enoyl-CoA hydratase 2